MTAVDAIRQAEAAVDDGQYSVGDSDRSAVAVGPGARAEINTYNEIILKIDSLEDVPPADNGRPPPYKGLAAYTEDPADVAYYVGREALSDTLARRLLERRFVAVAGDSGSGKSSLLRAGIAPRLRERNWRIRVITPTSRPLDRLAAALAPDNPAPEAVRALRRELAAAPDAPALAASALVAGANAAGLLLVVDQFEELYTLCADADERRAFTDALLATAGSDVAAVLVGVRADFTGRLADHEGLRARVTDNLALLGPMTQAELVRVIAEPAKRGGWAFVQGLMEQILSDVGEEPGRLPLLSHALRETWERRSGVVMTLRGYAEAGRVEGAITRTAEATFERLADHQSLVRDIFLALTEVSETGPDTRRVATRGELDALGDPAAVEATLDALADARLISLGDTVQVAHEALIRRWLRLQTWINESRADLLFDRQLRQAAALWRANDRQSDYLYRGRLLARAKDRMSDHGRALSDEVAAFLDASLRAEAEAQAAAERVREGARQEVRRAVPIVMLGGAAGLGLSGYLLTRLTAGPNVIGLGLLTAALAVLGALLGLLYGPVYDWVIARVGPQPASRRLAAAGLGFLIFGAAHGLLYVGSPAPYGLVFVVGGLWGVVAGLGRLWAGGQPARLAAVAAGSGAVLAAAYLALPLMGLDALERFAAGRPPPAYAALIAGALTPLAILFSDWLNRALARRRLA